MRYLILVLLVGSLALNTVQIKPAGYAESIGEVIIKNGEIYLKWHLEGLEAGDLEPFYSQAMSSLA